ncbi:MAG: acetyl-CoA carboxylase biotin carboxyl carrier protein [Lactovum sp.]
MKFSEVSDLMDKFERSSIRELFWREGQAELQLSKNDSTIQVSEKSSSIEKIDLPIQEVVKANEKEQDSPVVDFSVEKKEKEGETVKSPLVGVAYLKPAPDKAEFISVGDYVKKGQTLLIIEAMKVMNEIPAEKDGVVTEILVSTEQLIEFGQELVRIK